MPENNWFSHFSTFEEDLGYSVPVRSESKDPRFLDDSIPAYSRDLLLGRIERVRDFHICDWGEDRWPLGREVRNRDCDHMPVLHFVIAGRGTLNGRPIAAGDAILTDPAHPYSMRGDTETPLNYFWVRIRTDMEFFRRLNLFSFGEDGCGRFDFSGCLDHVVRLFRKGQRLSGNGTVLQFGIYSLFFEILSRCMQSAPNAKTITPYVHSAMSYIRQHYAENINVNNLADRLHVSRNHLRRLFLRDLGITPKDYITKCRIDAATALLESGSTVPLAQLADSVGYPSYSQFISAFRKINGCTPKEYRALR